LTPTLEISVDGNKIRVKNITSVKTKESEFELGGDWIEVEEEMTDLKGKRKAHMDGDKFVVVSVNDNGETTVTRSVDGNVLFTHIVFVKKDGSKIEAKRYFNKK